ncbi:MAG: hypothetical protein HY081_11695 [Gammaproteobacteria bacterium]|nr:hypothetical protein [Gammaproteobacteria bacterium]
MLSCLAVPTDTAQRIIYIPGKNPKPLAEQHRRELWRSLLAGVGHADPIVQQEIAKTPDVFSLIAWNIIYYQSYRSFDEDLPWIDALLKRTGATPEEIREALSFRRRTARFMYSLADLFNFLIPLLPDQAVKHTIQETTRYFANAGGIGAQVRELLKAPLREMLAQNKRVLIIGHSLGSVIAYDALWELTHIEKNPGRVDLFLTLGSPLGMRYTQQRLLGAHTKGKRRYPHNIRRWVNVAAQGDLTALDPILCDDFRAMQKLGLVESITDVNRGIFNYFRNDRGLNVHRSYGYLVNPRVGEIIAQWWNQKEAA